MSLLQHPKGHQNGWGIKMASFLSSENLTFWYPFVVVPVWVSPRVGGCLSILIEAQSVVKPSDFAHPKGLSSDSGCLNKESLQAACRPERVHLQGGDFHTNVSASA